MRISVFLVLFGGLLAALALGPLAAQEAQQLEKKQMAMSGGDSAHAADREAILKEAREFAQAYNRGDAQAIAALFTNNAECRDAKGMTIIGRANIEKAYADFFKANPGTNIEVLVKSIRFPAQDMAVEEGLLRQSRGPKDLPSSSSYVAVHIREGGKWKIALSSEAQAGQNRLEDLDWLLGEWTTKMKDAALKLAFVRDPKKQAITATFTRVPTGKEPISGTIRIALDPETGQLRSWGFEDDGAHSQALWVCDGKSWILDTRGVLADGTPTAERIVLQRVSPDIITWRAIDRMVGDAQLADTPPMRLTRSAPSK
jgi:uncharacterized protein (TIGR02246 family)